MIRLLVAAVTVCLALLLLGGCLKDHPLILPENGYDPAHTLRSDSLDRFETVEILLVDPEDTTRAILIFRGALATVDNLEPQVGGDGRTMVYLVRGWKSDRGHCFTEQVTREGSATILLDTCAKTDTVPDVKVPEEGRKVPPRFDRELLQVPQGDSTFTVTLNAFTGSAPGELKVAGYWKGMVEDSLPEVRWIRGLPMQVPAGRDTTFSLALAAGSMPPGIFAAHLVIQAADGADTLVVQIEVPPPPSGHLFGKVVDWRDSLPRGGWSVRLEGESIAQVTGADGTFDFGRRDPGRHVLSLSAEGRIGHTDTVDLKDKDEAPRLIVAAPAGSFREVPLSWRRQVGRVAVAAGHALVTTVEFDAPGSVAVFPLDNASASLQKFPDQGNWEGAAPDEYFEAGEIAADSGALYIAYPEQDRVGKVESWRGAARTLNVGVPFQPSALLPVGDALMVLGRNSQGTLVLGELDAATLLPRRVDTLSGHRWDGVQALDRGPRLAASGGYWFAVDGNGPSDKGRLLRIDRTTRKVDSWVELPEAGASDLAARDGRLYVTIADPAGKTLHVYGENLAPAGKVALGMPAHRIVFAAGGGLDGLGLVAAEGKTIQEGHAILVVRPGEAGPVGRLSLPGNLRALSLAVDGAAGRILATDGAKVYIAEF